MREGYAVDDGAALHFIDESFFTSVSSRPHARAYFVKCEDNVIIETEIGTIYLGDG
jgi:peptidase E